MNKASAAQPILDCPQGIEQSHVCERRWHKHASPTSIFLIGALLAAALLGMFGGQPNPVRKFTSPAATIETQFPEILRNGEFFEMRATVTAKRSFGDMRLAVDASFWRDLTINTFLPTPSDETSENGEYIFSYGPVRSGQTLTLKFDGQVNPPMFAGTKGRLKLMDGDKTLSVIPVALKVYP